MQDPAQPQSAASVMLLALFVVASTFVGRSFTALCPGSYDSMFFAYIGDQWRQGTIPYTGIWDNKPPGIFALVATVFYMFPGSFMALAVVEGIFVVGCVATIYSIMRELRAPWYATATATAVGAAAGNLLQLNEYGVLTEIYLIWPATLSMLFFIRSLRTGRTGWMVAAGICSGLASIFKPPGLAPFLAQMGLLIILLAIRRDPFPIFARRILANAGGILLAWTVPLAYFWWHDALGALLYASFLFNLSYGASGQPALHLILLNMATTLAPIASAVMGALIVCAYAVLAAVETRRSSNSPPSTVNTDLVQWLWLILLWVSFDIAGALAGGRNFSHYYLALVPSLAVSTGVACWLLVESKSPDRKAFVKRGAVIALFLGPLVFHQLSDLKEMERTVREGPLPDYWQGSVRFLNSVRRPDDTLFAWDYLPAVFFQTGMKSPLRFPMGHPLNQTPAARRVFGNEIIGGLQREMPTFLMDRTTDPEGRTTRNPMYGEFQKVVKRNYELVYSDKEFDIHIYRRRARPGG